MIASHQPELKNEYSRLVHSNGNPIAVQLIHDVFYPIANDWRGLGHIENSGYAIKEEYALWDAWKKFSLHPASDKPNSNCRCAQVIRGTFSPINCPLFRKICSPENPVGPCMVSGEGACAAAYQYEI